MTHESSPCAESTCVPSVCWWRLSSRVVDHSGLTPDLGQRMETPISQLRQKTMRQPTHPGEHIAVELAELGFSATQLAKELGIPANRVTEITRGRRSVTADTALRFAAWLGTTPEFWMNLQRNYDLKTTELERGEEIRRTVRGHNAAA